MRILWKYIDKVALMRLWFWMDEQERNDR